MIDLRALISARLKELDLSMSWLSKQLGQNRAYIQQWLERGSPRALDEQKLAEIARLLSMKPEQLGVRQKGTATKLAIPGLHENAEQYDPPERSFLAKRSNIAYFRVRDNSLDQHDPKIEARDVIVADMSAAAVAAKRSGQVVVAQLTDRNDQLRPRGTAVLIFLAPNKLVTNSSGDNFILNIDDPALPVNVHIRGVFLSLLKEVAH